MIGPLASMQQTDQAEKSARSAEESARRILDPREQSLSLKRIVQALCKNRPSDVARDMALRIPDPQQSCEGLLSIVDADIKLGAIEQAGELVRQAEDAASRIQHPMSRSAAFSQIVESLLRLDKPDDAHRLAKEVAVPPDRSSAMAKVSKAMSRRHRLREAREIAESCDLATDRLDAFTTLVSEYTKMHKPQLTEVIDGLEARTVVPRRPNY